MIGYLISTTLCVILLFLSPGKALSDIVVYDIVSPAGKEVMLNAEVKGRLFKKGGEVVEFSVNGKTIGKSLTGGDGFAFKQFIPFKSGRYQISVRTEKEEGKGLLLCISKGSGIVFVDLEGSILERFSNKPRKGSQESIKEINRRFPVVLLKTGPLNINIIKEWLKKNGFPNLPLIPWKQGIVFTEFVEKGFRIKAVIGGTEVINSAKEYKPLAFSFEEAEEAVEVKDWEEIKKRLIDINKSKDK
ncbi:MAG: hypothetical protein ACPL1G_03300 [Thermodesulfovibrionales bacterium]